MLLAGQASAQYPGWKHSGSFFILTTPEGADLPATALVEGFPLLVRLHRDFFDFQQAMPNGEDLRFASSTGQPLVYQIEEWDAGRGFDNVFVDKQAQRGGPLPLKNADWNKLKLILTGDMLTLELNDQLIYERKIDPTNQRHFGLFHDSGNGQVRVRNVVYRGDWPKLLPQIADQELAGDR